MADKGDHPGVHIDPADFYKDTKQGAVNKNIKKEGEWNKDKQEDKNLNKDAGLNMEKSKNNVGKNFSTNEKKNVQ